MSTIRTGIELQDNFSGVMYGIVSATNYACSSMGELQQTMNSSIDTSSIEGARNDINEVAAAVDELNDSMNRQRANVATPNVDTGNQAVINADVNPILPDPLIENPQPIEMPIQPNAPPTDELTQKISEITGQMNSVIDMQQRINETSANIDVLPDDVTKRISKTNSMVEQLQANLNHAVQNPFELNNDMVELQLNEIRQSLERTTQTQNQLNTAMGNMDVSGANDAYLRLSSSVSTTERYIRDNTDEQGRFNQEIQEGTTQANNLMDTIKGAVAAYLSVQAVGNVLNISDELTQTKSRLDMMNDGLQSTDELVNMVYAAAQDARGSFSQMADVVARFGNNAKDAFGSSEEVVAFADLIQKQMTIAGASTSEASNAMLQLSQALGSGVLRGDELNSIFEQAPNLIQNIADYLNVPIGQIREMASEGELSADTVKAAIYAASDDINAKFEQMPMTWGQIWQSMQNTATMAFQPVLQRINDIANSEAFQNFVNGAIQAMATLANVVLNIFDLIGMVGGFIADNWSIISPIVYGVIAALAVYGAYLAITKGLELASAAASGVLAVAQFIKVAAMAASTGATIAATAAQMGLNGAMYACPIVWIIMLIIALIAIIFAVCNAIADLTGVANSGFGVITGGINVVIQFFKNLGLSVANIALGIGNAIAALGSNIMTAFHNAIASVQSWWYDLLSTALTVVEGICEALNKLPFVEFDYSGISSAADDYAAKSADAAASKESYKSIGDAFNEGMSTFDTFQDGWASTAFDAGASWGDGIADKVSNFSLSDMLGSTDIPKADDYTSGFSDAIANSGMGDNLSNISGDTSDISDSLEISSENLKYLRDIAEQESVNRYTTAEVKIEQTNHNNISSNMDLDGFIDGLNDAMGEAIEIVTEGGIG